MWISLDGIAGSGKSSVAARLSETIGDSYFVPEFSPSPIGRHLQAQVERSPHFIEHTPLSQSLLFISDHSDLAADALRAQAGGYSVVIQDRGFLSKYVYQLMVLRSHLGFPEAVKLMVELFRHVPRPEVTVLLDLELQLALDRHTAAGRMRPGDVDRTFLADAIDAFREECARPRVLGACTVLTIPQDASSTVDDIAGAVVAALY